MIPHRKWMHQCENELMRHYTFHTSKRLLYAHLHLNSPAVTYYRRRQMDSMYGGERGGGSKTFFSKSAQHQMRMERYRNSPSLALAEWSELQQQDLCHLRGGGWYDTVLHHLLEAAAANVPLWLRVQFPGGLSLHMYYPLCPWAGHYLGGPSGGIWRSVNGWTMCMES